MFNSSRLVVNKVVSWFASCSFGKSPVPSLGTMPPSPLALAALALAARALLACFPYSGAGRPPMFGDVECQRHWMEVTLNLPLHEWYAQTPRNDLLYWGLDYPPLTAYLSWAFGALARVLQPDMVALGTSRGIETLGAIAFMRGTALLLDAVLWLPVALAFGCLWQARADDAVRVSSVEREGGARGAVRVGGTDLAASGAAARGLPRELALLLLQPAIMLVDHGHFQWNCAVWGLCAGALLALARRQWLLAAGTFALALHVKQMVLYYAPAMFVVLLVVCMRGGVAAVQGGSVGLRSSPALWDGAAAVALVGATVLAIALGLWAPFCVWSTPLPGATDGGCIAGLSAVLHRIFPLGRGLFEDKVSNLWCALEPVLRLRARVITDDALGGGLRGRVAAASAVLTLVLMLPALVGLARRLARAPQLLVVAAAAQGRVLRVQTKASRAPLVASDVEVIMPLAVATGNPAAWAHDELAALALACSSLAFFLASYQVHEKSILLPLLPLALLARRLPLMSAWFSLTATWSMWPLLVRDGLFLPSMALLALHAALGWPRSAHAIAVGDGAFLSAALRGAVSPATAATIGQAVALSSVGGMLLLSLAAALVPPPPALPDLWPLLSAAYGALLLLAALVGLSAGMCAPSPSEGKAVKGE